MHALMASSGSMVYIATIVPFYFSQGLTTGDVFLVQTVFAAMMLLGEIPTGYVSDRWGRRKTLMLGSVLRLLGLGTYCLGTGLPHFVAAEILIALGLSFHSGTVDALLYDTLLEDGKTQGYRRASGINRAWFFGAEGLASLLGGLLASINLRWPFYASLVPYTGTLLISALLREPHRHRPQVAGHLRTMLAIAAQTVRSRHLRLTVILFSVLSTMGLSLFWFTQPYQTAVGLPLVFFGIAHTVVVWCGAVASRVTHRLERWVSDRALLLWLALGLMGSYVFLAAFPSLGILLLFPLGRMCWAIVMPLTNDMVNRHTSSDVRATVLSVKAFGHRLLFTLTAPVLGYLTDALDLRTAMMIAGVIGGSVTLLMLARFWKVSEPRPGA